VVVTRTLRRLYLTLPLNLMRHETSKTLVIAIVAALAMIAAGYGLLLLAPNNPATPPQSSIDILLPSGLVTPQPKPRDRFVFIGIVIAIPLCLAAVLVLARRLRLASVDPIPILLVLLGFAGLIATFKGAFGATLALRAGGQGFISLACIAIALSLVAAASRWPDRVATLSFRIAVCLACAIVLGLRVWTEHNVDYATWFTSHGEAVLFSMMRIASGDTCLVEALPQYGCYGEFLAPILRAVGPSVLSMTAVLGVLQVVAVTAALLFARSLISSPSLLVASILSLFVIVVLNLVPNDPDPILQYYPIRFVFPGLSTLVVGWLQARPNLQRAFGAGVYGGAAIAWNLESGLAVSIALTIFASLTGLSRKSGLSWSNIKVRLLSAMTVLAGSSAFLAAFVLYLTFKSGAHVNLANYFVYQTTFYFTGFGMIPIPPFPDYWTIHAATIFAVMLYGVLVAACESSADRSVERAVYLAILGIGLTLYYSGRSHWLVLKLIAWPDAILIFFLADRALRMSIAGKFDKTLILGKTLAVSVPAAYLSMQVPAVWRLVTVPRTAANTKTQLEEDLAFIAAHTQPGERVVIFNYEQSTLHAHTGTRPALPGPSVAEMIRKVDLADMQKAMIERGPQKIFIGVGLKAASRVGLLSTDLALDINALGSVYALAAWGPDKRIMALRRKPFDGVDLFTAGNP
jgi:hypothetical protein